MTWRKALTALSLAVLFAAINGGETPAFAGPGKAALLAGLRSDQSLISGWVSQIEEMIYIGNQRAPIFADLSSASASVDALYQQTLVDTSALALSTDARRIGFLHSELMMLEGRKIGTASRANDLSAEFNALVRAIQSSGGLNANSPIHSQVMAMQAQMRVAKANLDQAVGLLDRATFGDYPASLGLLAPAQSLIAQAFTALFAVNQLARHLSLPGTVQTRYQEQAGLFVEFSTLSQLQARVFADPNLSYGERSNLLGQINADVVALGRLNRCLALAAEDKCLLELTQLEELDALLLIRPKTEIMLGAAASRSAIAELTALLPILESGIATAAPYYDVTKLNSMLSDLKAQLAGASADISPIDSELEPMTFSPAQRSSDLQVIQADLVALADASNRLTAARSDAGQIVSAIS